MDHDTLVIVPASPSVAPLLDLLHLLHHQRLVRPCFVWVAGDTGCRSIADDPRSSDTRRYDLVDFIRGECDEFGIVHLLLTDAPSTEASRRLAEEAEQMVRDSLSYSEEQFRQRLHLVNLVAPSADAGCLPVGSALVGSEARWTNLVVMPEVQERPDLAVVPIRPDEEYVSHVAVNLASVVGLWVGSSLGSAVGAIPAPNRALSVDHWNLVRTRERLITAPELPDIVLGGVTTTILTSARRRGLQLDMVADRDVHRLLDAVISRFSTTHRLVAVEPPPADVPEQKIVSVRQFFMILRLFLRSVPGRVVAEIGGWVRSVRQFFMRRLNRAVGTDELSIHIGERDHRSASTETARAVSRPIRAASIDAEPDLWAGLRRLAFGMLDGGEPDAPYQDVLQRGTQRLILPDPRWCVSSAPQEVVATPPVASSDDPTTTGDEPGEVVETSIEGSPAGSVASAFVDRVVADFASQHAVAADITLALRERYDERRTALERERVASSRWRNRLWKFVRGVGRLLRRLLVIALVVALLVAIPVLLPLAGVLAIVVIAVLYGAIVVLVVLRVLRVLARWFRDELRREQGVTELSDLQRRIADAEDQQERLRQLLAVAPEWRDIIRFVVYEPFGPPTRSTVNRIREMDLMLPDSHKVEEGETADFRESGIIEVIRESVFSSGWLQTQYAGAIDYLTREQQIAQPGASFVPDNDASQPGGRQTGDRQRLLLALQSGRAMRDSRMRLVHQVHRQLATGQDLPLAGTPLVDWLFTEVSESTRATAFLAEVDRGRPSEWNRSLLRLKIGQPAAFQDVERVTGGTLLTSALPELPDAESVLLGKLPEYEPLLFRSSCIEMSYNVPEESILVFASAPTPVAIDLSRAAELWIVPPPVDSGEVEEFTDEERDRWGIGTTPFEGGLDVIVPSGPVLPPKSRGPYTFMVESFGRPVPIKNRRLRYMIRTDAAPPNATEIISHVLQHTADVTGLEFEFAGVRQTIPRPNERIDYLFLGWAFNSEYRRYEAECGFTPGTSIGLGGPISEHFGNGTIEIIGGTAVLNAEMAVPHAMDHWPNHALVLLHEVGHALNLGHVASSREVMMQGAWATGLTAWGPGDRRGLQLVTAEAVLPGSRAA